MQRARRNLAAALAAVALLVLTLAAPAMAESTAAPPGGSPPGTRPALPVIDAPASDSPQASDPEVSALDDASATGGALDPAAGSTFHIDGGGWGHGVGMSQYGAYGRALHGQTAEQIIGFYYQGTQVQPLGLPSGLRIWMAETDGTSGVMLAAGPQPMILTSVNGAFYAAGPGVSARVTVSAGVLRVNDGAVPGVDRIWADLDAAAPVIVTPPGLRFNRGRVEVILTPSGGLRVVVAKLSMQEYLYGLSEVPSSWPMEALRAQAIAGRSYASEKILRSGLDRPSCSCSLVGTQGDQVYAGYEKEGGPSGDRWVSAVDSTNAVVATYDGWPIQAFYSSSNGGYTEASEGAFVAALPYLRAQPDPEDAASPDFRWSRDYSQADLSRWLAAAPDTDVGTVLRIEVLGPLTASGRVGPVLSATQGGVRITGTAGEKRVSGARFQTVVNNGVLGDGLGYSQTIKSLLFTVPG
jgi:SpoIID/LytB domain protein